jgi:hypothetical protein
MSNLFEFEFLNQIRMNLTSNVFQFEFLDQIWMNLTSNLVIVWCLKSQYGQKHVLLGIFWININILGYLMVKFDQI